MDIPVLAALLALVVKVVDFLKLVLNSPTQRSAIITQATAWVGGIICVVIANHSQLFDGFNVNGIPLTKLDGPSLVFLGLGIASLGSLFVDAKQALDGSDSAVKPPMLKPKN